MFVLFFSPFANVFFFLFNVFLISLKIILCVCVCVRKLLPLALFFLSLFVFVSSFLVCFFRLTYSCCKFIIHSKGYPCQHKSRSASRTSFLSKMVFFSFLFVLQDPSIYSPINEMILWGTFPSQYWHLYLPKSICSPHCQRINPRYHPRPQKKKKKKKTRRNHPQVNPTPTKFTTFKQVEQVSFIHLLRRNSENAGSKALQKPLSCSISMRHFPYRGFWIWNGGFPIKRLHFCVSKTSPTQWGWKLGQSGSKFDWTGRKNCKVANA